MHEMVWDSAFIKYAGIHLRDSPKALLLHCANKRQHMEITTRIPLKVMSNFKSNLRIG